MSGSLFLRTLRGASLFVAGMLVAGTSISVAAPVTPSATLTRTVSCSGLNFHPIDDRTTFRWTGRMLWRFNNQGDGWFLCDPNLPNKAIVTKVRFTVKDADSDVNVQNCALVRSGLGTSGGTPAPLAVITATGMAAKPGTVRRSDTSISHATIDQTAYTYWLQCQILFDDGLVSLGGGAAGIIGADVTYKIEQHQRLTPTA